MDTGIRRYDEIKIKIARYLTDALLQAPAFHLTGRTEHVQIFPEDLVGYDGEDLGHSIPACAGMASRL